jgi:6-pyruvoyltetrahydropterin/6-carboxytetrahydropterin synthase
MFTLCVRDTFAAAHRLEAYHGKCEALHGHNFRVEALFRGETIGKEGMLVDFAVLKGHLKDVLSGLDHKYINDIPFFKERASSSEYLALYLYEALKEKVTGAGVAVHEVRVWESENAYAAYGG